MRDFERYSLFYDHVLLAVPAENPINQKLARLALTAGDILNRRHLEADCPSSSLTNFCELEYILLRPGNNLHERAISMFQNAGFKPKVKLCLAQLATAYHLAEESFAAAFVSDRMVRNPDTPLMFYKLDSPLTERLFYVLLPDRNYTSHAVKMLIQYLLLHV